MPLFYFRKLDFHPKELTQQEQDARVIRIMLLRIVITLLVLLGCAIPVLIMLASGR